MDQNVKDIAVLVGSLRRDSTNRKTALALAALAPERSGSISSIPGICRSTIRNSMPMRRARPMTYREVPRSVSRRADGVHLRDARIQSQLSGAC